MNGQEKWRDSEYSFFAHKKCEYFPCHETDSAKDFNCLFCYCPLYAHENCGGDYFYTQNGLKSCKNCNFPHERENFGEVRRRLTADPVNPIHSVEPFQQL